MSDRKKCKKCGTKVNLTRYLVSRLSDGAHSKCLPPYFCNNCIDKARANNPHLVYKKIEER